MTLELTGDVAVVTGANSGIGLATSRQLSENGAFVVGIDIDTSPPAGESSGSAFDQAVANGTLVEGDVSDLNDVERAVDRAREEGPIGIAVNNAGIGSRGGIEQITLEELRQIFRINVEGNYNVCRCVVPDMVVEGAGSIINVTSIAALQGWSGMFGYSASKGAIISLTRELAAEVSPDGVRVNAIAPGFIKTSMNEDVWKDDVEAKYEGRYDYETAKDRTILPELGEPEDIAGTATFLASDASRFITGQTIVVDGGWTISAL